MRTVRPSILPLLLCLSLAGPAGAGAGEEAPQIQITPRITPEERARRAAEEERRRAALRPAMEAWCRGYEPAVRPLERATDEALGSLRIAWGPWSRNLGYPVRAAASALRQGSLPAPDPLLDRQLRRALEMLEEGADACLRGMPTIAQWRLEAGQRRLERVAETIAEFEVGIPCGPARP